MTMKRAVWVLACFALVSTVAVPRAQAYPLTLTITSSTGANITVTDNGAGPDPDQNSTAGILEYQDMIDGVIYDMTMGSSWPPLTGLEPGTLARLILESTNINNTNDTNVTLSITLSKDYDYASSDPVVASAEGRFDMVQSIAGAGIGTSTATLQSWIINNTSFAETPLYSGLGIQGTATPGGGEANFSGAGSAVVLTGSYTLKTLIQVDLAPESYMTITEGRISTASQTVPEPASLLLITSGLAGLAMRVRSRRNRKRDDNVLSA